MKASDPPWGSPPNAYELLKVEIEYFVQNYYDKYGRLPTNDAMQLEACRIVFAAEPSAMTHSNATDEVYGSSWLRDLILSSPELTRQARFGPIRTSSESRHSPLKINGQDHLFEQCPLEAQLHAFVFGRQAFAAPLDDNRLYNEACDIVRRLEKESKTPSDIFANWIVKGIYSGMDWLSDFKQRVGIPGTVNLVGFSSDPSSTQDWDKQWTQAVLDPMSTSAMNTAVSASGVVPPEAFAAIPAPQTSFDVYGNSRMHLPDDTNFYRVFDSDMKRWAAATMSPKNPNYHVPSDEEIQHQARWIMFGGDDSWNQTPADYEAWLRQFKRSVGISTDIDFVDPAKLTKHSQ